MAGTNGNGKRPRLNLDLLLDDAGVIEHEGKDYRVLQFNGPQWKVYDRIRDAVAKAIKGEAVPEEVSTDEFYGLLSEVLVAPKEVAWGIRTQKAGAILHFAAQMLQVVEENAPPNVEGPTVEVVETSPPSSA